MLHIQRSALHLYKQLFIMNLNLRIPGNQDKDNVRWPIKLKNIYCF